jgi:hypothetical protein
VHRIGVIAVLVLPVILGESRQVAAQSSSSSGLFSNRTTNTGLGSGSSGFNGLSSGGSSFGSAGTIGQSNFGLPTSSTGNGTGGQMQTASSFVGTNTNQLSQRNYVGAAQLNGLQAGLAGNGMGGLGLNGMGMEGVGLGGMSEFGLGALVEQRLAQRVLSPNLNNSENVPRRTVLTLAFQPTGASSSTVGSAIAARLAAMPALHWQAPAEVAMQGRTAVLRGVVATQHDRDLAERVVRLEAAVDRVRNEIVVAGQTNASVPATVGQ